jgi:hypothetical protein
MFEVFRVGHEPDCERIEELEDPFNNAVGTDPVREETEENDEPIF